jgi:hypothetical protein
MKKSPRRILLDVGFGSGNERSCLVAAARAGGLAPGGGAELPQTAADDVAEP